MKKLLIASLLTGVMAVPAYAQMADADMSCADFMAMDADAQMEALHTMSSDSMMAEGAMADDSSMMAEGAMADNSMTAEDDMTAEDGKMAESVAAMCTDHPDMMLGDAMMEAEHN